ncbi:uncharacterized protein LAESUDRAFT_450779 [Laetiporus sulphureus 93-53]|uniref:DUF6534 domain-containing protein n=1 Tax=Laetiporus sulphureus 93-53 TaxID=1314785 RepID=A0A165BWN4_9APHY|nr:uncharacterized protein LAESUDRAFT_450779 [Laetiporus sulphureus 93-53]KZT01788.1 hypothetical protein LAESUDRAFT_450779 [Laetiporus sulphureus 93-53]
MAATKRHYETMTTSLEVRLLTGPEFLGMLLNWALLGMLFVQVYIYHVCFPKDPLSLRLFVYGVLIYEIIQSALIAAVGFDYYVYDYGDVSGLTTYHNGWFSVPVMCGVMSAAVQCFFAWRIWVISKLRILVGAIVTIALAQMSIAIVGGVKLKLLTSTSDENTVTPYIDAWLAGSALDDIIIAISMTIFLSRAKKGFKASDALLNRLITLVIETGSLTATIATIDLILFTTKPQTYLHTAPVLVLSKLYANTLLINFNNRAVQRRPDDTIISLSRVQPEASVSSNTPPEYSVSRGFKMSQV